MLSQLTFSLTDEMCSAEVVMLLQERVEYNELMFTVSTSGGQVVWQVAGVYVYLLSKGRFIHFVLE
jgi:hypothetical protein